MINLTKKQGGKQMRLRNIPRAQEEIDASPVAIKDEKNHRGKWAEVFGNEHPIHIEIGMGKGQFILELAKRNPEINYIGIERYSSVLLRALEKFSTEEYEELQNIRFICMDAAELDEIFASEEVEKIYLNLQVTRHLKSHIENHERLVPLHENDS